MDTEKLSAVPLSAKRKRKGKGRAQDIFDAEDKSEEDVESGLGIKSDRKERQLSDLPPFREGCVDLVKEVPDGHGKRYESYANRIGTSLPVSSTKPLITQPYASASMRDPFIQIPTSYNTTPIQIKGITAHEESGSDEDENDDPLRTNRANFSTSIKSLEKNIWNDDIWK